MVQCSDDGVGGAKEGVDRQYENWCEIFPDISVQWRCGLKMWRTER